MADDSYDLVIVGGGPGGYTCAIRAAQLGLKVAIIEKDKSLGGTCLNVGCIPSKALLESSEHYEHALHGLKAHGVDGAEGNIKLNLDVMMKRKEKIVQDLRDGINFLMKKNKITRLAGTGRLKSATQVEIKSDSGTQTVTGKNILLATGSVPIEIPSLKFDGKRIISSTEALSLPQVPKHLIVVGGGVIGLELGSVWLRLGSKVTVVEMLPKIGGAMDNEVSSKFQKILEKQGFQFLLNTKVLGAEVSGQGANLSYEPAAGGGKSTLSGDVILVAVGRKPYTDGLGLETAGVSKDNRGMVTIDKHFRTNVPTIYAIGDVVRGPMLAHKAEEEGVAVAETVAGKVGHVNEATTPFVVYTWPEVAWVGQTEEQLKEKNIAYAKGSFPFMANGRAKALGNTDGFVKILADKSTDRILGVHILGPRASDLLGEAIVAMEFDGSAEDLARSYHAHPTLTEVIREAALAVAGRARQM